MATDKEKLEQAAKLQQMNINTRLVALETGLKIMHTPNYSGVIDHITLLAYAQEIEGYILGTIEDDTKKILEELNKPKPNILRVQQ